MSPERMADYRKRAAAISPSIGTPPQALQAQWTFLI
jgi:hypothetical protein